jgi:ATP synthase assembly factor FMC1, mitochondrial
MEALAHAHARSLYRSILRELPARTPVTKPSSIRSSIRKHISSAPQDTSQEYQLARRQEAEQFIQYLKAQRTYGFLLERYNPGMGMDEEERVRLTARRVGMELPVQFKKS